MARTQAALVQDRDHLGIGMVVEQAVNLGDDGRGVDVESGRSLVHVVQAVEDRPRDYFASGLAPGHGFEP